MSVVLITGSSGLVGSESVNFFSKKGFDVIGIDKIFFWERRFNILDKKQTTETK